MPGMRLPDQEHKKSYKLELYDMIIDGMKRPHFHYTLTENGISIRMEGMELWGHGTYRISKKMIAKNCNAGVGDVELDFHGRAAWIINLFTGYLNDKARREINKKACQYLQDAIVDANTKILSTPLHFDLKDDLSLDYRFLHMVHNAQYTETWLAGSVTMGKFHCSIHATPMDAGPNPGDFMTTVLISEQLASCVLDSAHTAGLIQVTFTKHSRDIEKSLKTSCSEEALTELCMGTLFPELAIKYPNQHVDAVCYANQTPKLSLSKTASLDLSLSLDLFLHPKADNPNRLATLEINSTSHVFVRTEDTMLKVRVKNTKVQLKETFSEIGRLSFLGSYLIASFEQLLLNVFLQKPIPVPVFREAAMAIAGNPQHTIENGFVRVDANFVHH
ncbi:unnamed protein product, partial [Mesorhabditis belari]|uniref:Lipid-binding serum glycoprotein C-terminal domain-containing protein n=1 Tax=Mesorhabditis belari TaxID=2138241 RepID=A0AAF3F249_9BILA